MTRQSIQPLYSAQLGSIQTPRALKKERRRLDRGETKAEADLYDLLFREAFGDRPSSSSSASSNASSMSTSRRGSFSPRKIDKGPNGQVNEFEQLKAHATETQRYGKHFQEYLDREAARRKALVAAEKDLDNISPWFKQVLSATVNPRDVMPYENISMAPKSPSPMFTSGSSATLSQPTSRSTSRSPSPSRQGVYSNTNQRDVLVGRILQTQREDGQSCAKGRLRAPGQRIHQDTVQAKVVAGRIIKAQRGDNRHKPRPPVDSHRRWKCTFPGCTQNPLAQKYNIYAHSRRTHAGLRTTEEHNTAEQV